VASAGDPRPSPPPLRVVSLVPSATETLLAWGITPIGVTRFCEQPDLPAYGGTKDPQVDTIAALEPDLVVVCVEENRREDAEQLEALGMRLHAIDIHGVADVAPELDRLADALGVDVPPVVLPPARPPTGLRAFVPIWRRPWMTVAGDTYVSSVLEWVGLGNAYGDLHTETDADRYPTIDLDDAIARAPDLVIAPDEPYPFGERHREELESVGPTVFIDGKDVTWWGVRTPAAVDRLSDLVGSLER
jgi:ABC-type Fe3+-hydroxamate transport system substrate-binding protein